ncbi:MAG TPA: hypothetical protein VLA08_02215 [Nitrosopumilus sp.]|nr:hypothetical protein [Nitrosopumilus sp.]
MEKNTIRESLGHRLEVADIEYDIKRMSAELNYHKSKAKIFEQTIRARQDELDEMFGVTAHSADNGEMYQ